MHGMVSMLFINCDDIDIFAESYERLSLFIRVLS